MNVFNLFQLIFKLLEYNVLNIHSPKLPKTLGFYFG